MGTYIDHVETLVLDAWMLAKDVIVLHHKHRLAEINFLDSILDEAVGALDDPSNHQKIKLKNFWWCGTHSATSFEDTLIEKIAPKIMGRVEAIFTYEGGMGQDGLIIVDGVVTKCDVPAKLVPSAANTKKK